MFKQVIKVIRYFLSPLMEMDVSDKLQTKTKQKDKRGVIFYYLLNSYLLNSK